MIRKPLGEPVKLIGQSTEQPFESATGVVDPLPLPPVARPERQPREIILQSANTMFEDAERARETGDEVRERFYRNLAVGMAEKVLPYCHPKVHNGEGSSYLRPLSQMSMEELRMLIELPETEYEEVSGAPNGEQEVA